MLDNVGTFQLRFTKVTNSEDKSVRDLQIDMAGPLNTSKIDSIMYMGNFFRGSGDMKIREMDLSIALGDGSEVYCDVRLVPQTKQWLYRVNFGFLAEQQDNYQSLSILADISEDLFGIRFNREPSIPEGMMNPFSIEQDLSLGAMVFNSYGLVRGTIPEKNAQDIITRLRLEGRLTIEDIANLEEYDSALTTESPSIRQITGHVLQPYRDIRCSSFAKLLLNPPEELRTMVVGFYTENEASITLGNRGYAKSRASDRIELPLDGFKIPKIQLSVFSDNEQRLFDIIDHAWETYQIMTGESIEKVREII